MNACSLFAGIEGFGLALADNGIEVAWVSEFAEFPASIIEARTGAPNTPDVRDAIGNASVDLVVGGFPCQDISLAGVGAGITGSRSSLWGAMAAVIADQEPRLVIAENVSALLGRGLEVVIADLAAMGYGVEWDCLPAASVGAPHLRDRVFIVAHKIGAPAVFGDPVSMFPSAIAVGESGWRKYPRAGFATGVDEVVELEPLARITDVKKGRRLMPTARAQDGKHSTATDYELGRDRGKDLLHVRVEREARELWPTAVASDALGSRRATARTAAWASNPGTTLLDAVSVEEGIEWARPADPEVEPASVVEEPPALFPTAAARDWKDGASTGRMGRGQLPEAVRDRDPAELWPTPRASGSHDSGGGETGTYRRTPSQEAGTHGRYLQSEAVEAELEAGRLSDEGLQALKTQTKTGGALNPDWVEWLMGFPIGWTNLEATPIPHPGFTVEPEGIPRVAVDIPQRRERLTALGNALVPQVASIVISRALDALNRED